MYRRTLGAALAALALLGAAPAFSQSAPGDAAQVQVYLDAYQAGWAAGDAEAMYRLASDDVEWVNVVGMHWRGKAEVIEAHRVYMTTIFRGVTMSLVKVESVRALGDGAVVAVALWSVGAYTTPGGHVAPASQDRMTLVFRRTDAGLRLAHAANIEVVAAAAASNPINGWRPAR
jgi:uncharacterized protein (TIGR02246 family)